jgi:hypothetical protein
MRKRGRYIVKTVYSAEYSAKYDVLFKEAFLALDARAKNGTTHRDEDGKAEDGYHDREDIVLTDEELATGTFTSLEEYYTRIGDLTRLHADQVHTSEDNEGYSKYSKFLMLPMDEIHGNNVLVIDPNSRAINVPASFSRNGVSVTGDELAETLLFEIDRFFDITDLVTTDIYVQWTNPAGLEGASKITMIDYNSKSGKLLFGWPLTSKVTVENANQTNGQLKFAVRFFKRDGSGKINYSLNTLPATVTIKQALYTDWNDTIEIDDPSQELKQAIENGPASDGPEPQVPVFFTDLHEIRYLDEGALDTFKESAELEVRVGTTDSGVRDYYWYFKPRYIKDNKVIEGDTEDHFQAETYTKTNDGAAVPGKKYYKDMGEGGFMPYDPQADDFDISLAYEPNSVYLVQWAEGKHVTGNYWVEARNRVGKRTAKAESKTTLIPCPETIAYATDGKLATDMFLEYGETPEDGEAPLLEKPIRVNAVATPAACDIAYKWEYTPEYNGAMSEVMIVDSEGVEVGPASTAAVLNTNKPGWYCVTATASLNKEDMYVVSDNTCRVLAPIKKPVVTPAAGGEAISLDVTLDTPTKISVSVEALAPHTETDGIVYTWYRNKPDQNGTPITLDDPDIVAINNNEITVKLLSTDADWVEFFYCVVTNKLADQTASTTSALFNIV